MDAPNDALTDTPETAPHEKLTLPFVQSVYQQWKQADQSGDDDTIAITSFTLAPLNRGVLSQVLTLALEPTSTKWLVKCLQPEFAAFTTSMFACEIQFYTSGEFSNFPFALPSYIHSSIEQDMLILDFIDDPMHISCVTGCPAHHISDIMTRLGQLHGLYWQYTPHTAQLNDAGIGANVPMSVKIAGFRAHYREFIHNLNTSGCLEDIPAQELMDWCTTVAQDQTLDWSTLDTLTRPNETLASFIHGDLHVANFIFQSLECLYLVDWATCGRGHPCRDLVHFFICSWNHWASDGFTFLEEQYLTTYMSSLRKTLAKEYRVTVTTQVIREAFLLNLWNEFLTLVHFDTTTKSFASSAGDRHDSMLHHFRLVNQRCALAILQTRDLLQPLLPRRS